MRLLLIEDNPGDIRLIREMLRDAPGASIRLDAATTLADGRARLQSQRYDAILLDLSLPDAQGLATFQALQVEAIATPIVVLTGLDDETVAVAAVHGGAQDYLVKGQVDSHLLSRAVRYAIERHQAELERRMLARTTEALFRSIDYDTTLNVAAELASPEFADGCIVGTLADGAQPVCVAVAARTEELAAGLRQLCQTNGELADAPNPAREALQRGAVYMAPAAAVNQDAAGVAPDQPLNGLANLGIASVIAAPLHARGRIIGVITYVRTPDRPAFQAKDGRLAEEIARRCAVAIDNARLYTETQAALERERAARSSAERLAVERAAILRQIADGVVLADQDGVLTFVNEAAHRLHGLDQLDPADCPVTGRGGPQRIQEAAWLADECPLRWVAATGEPSESREWTIQRPDGSQVVVSGSATPVRLDDGSLLGTVLTMHDVTARRELDLQKDRFFANISHDLRTPITAIKASIGVVLSNLPASLPEPLKRLLSNIDLSAEELNRLVESLLELTRLQVGRVQLRLGLVSLGDRLRRAARAIEPLAASRGQTIHLLLPDEPVMVVADVDRIDRVLANLVGNAQKFGLENGSIDLRLDHHDDVARIEVGDDGPGIAEAEHERVFERYYRSESVSAKGTPGSGLGLPIARALVELHGGRLGLTSQIGRGSTFWLELPIGKLPADPSTWLAAAETDGDDID